MQNLNPVPKLLVDPEQIQKVLTNLILNAADAVGEKGEICISTVSRDGWVELGVSDTGCGISQEFKNECLFRPFKTTKPQGTGIGLFQSKMIVETHAGSDRGGERHRQGACRPGHSLPQQAPGRSLCDNQLWGHPGVLACISSENFTYCTKTPDNLLSY